MINQRLKTVGVLIAIPYLKQGNRALPGMRRSVSRFYRLSDRQRLEAKPDITLLWQFGSRNNLAFPPQIKLDVNYIEIQGFVVKIKTTFESPPPAPTSEGNKLNDSDLDI